MSYVSLARKYRPRRFVDMVGQESTTLALTNAIRLRREPHSVIFTGVRGVGKTTSARIYAKALNCEKGPTADPCDVCGSCQAITAGNHEDVLEIDGASNTGVDDVRALQETLSYVPQRSTYKIYIIDEVHMLSISAFNALLKTLEEPPQHVVFIFATTELHKVPETIQSRCQVFHLQKISRPIIAERIKSILNAEEIPFDEAALALVAREGRGSMRDALTMLDQAIAVGGGQVSIETLKNMVGSSSQALPVLEFLDGLLRKDAGLILEVIARWDQEGHAMAVLVEETAKACRNAFILRDLKGQAIDLQILELEDREQQMLLELGEKALPMDLNRLFRLLAKCLDDLRHADLDRFILENYSLEWCFDPGLPDLQTLMNVVAGGQPLPQVQARPAPTAAPATEGGGVNLRDRWKTSAPAAVKSPGSPTVPQPSPAPKAPVASAPLPPSPAAPLPAASVAKSTLVPPPAASAPMSNAPSAPVASAPISNAPSAPAVSASISNQPSAAAAPKSNAPSAPAAAATLSNPAAAAPLASNPVAPPSPAQSPKTPAPQAPIPQAPAPQNPEPQVPNPKPQAPVPPPASVQSAPQGPGRSGAARADDDEEMPPWALAASLEHELPPGIEPETKPGAVKDPKTASETAKPESFLQQMARRAAEAPRVQAHVPAAAPVVETAPASGPVWPETWRGFVDEWKKQKPLQARVLEEANMLEYSPTRIRLAVEPQSMAGGKLLQADVRKRLMEQFAQLFGFQGMFEAVPKTESSANSNETILEVKHREREVAREQLRQRVEDHPVTREVISRFGGTIEQIDLQ